MEIQILQLLEGAARAEGLTVVIDVLRAFSLECFLASWGAAELRPVGALEEAFAWRERDPAALLIGERGGAKCEGFDFGNSPTGIPPEAVRGRRIIHTTSGSLVNAAAVAAYIRRRSPEKLSLVCMGNAGVREAPEDVLCAEYVRSLVLGEPIPDLEERIRALRWHGGEHFFNPDTQHIYPEPDFWACMRRDLFPFVLRVRRDALGLYMEKVEVL